MANPFSSFVDEAAQKSAQEAAAKSVGDITSDAVGAGAKSAVAAGAQGGSIARSGLKAAGAAGGAALGAKAGAAVGQALIPIPGVGAAIGAFAGKALGGAAGSQVDSAVLGSAGSGPGLKAGPAPQAGKPVEYVSHFEDGTKMVKSVGGFVKKTHAERKAKYDAILGLKDGTGYVPNTQGYVDAGMSRRLDSGVPLQASPMSTQASNVTVTEPIPGEFNPGPMGIPQFNFGYIPSQAKSDMQKDASFMAKEDREMMKFSGDERRKEELHKQKLQHNEMKMKGPMAGGQ